METRAAATWPRLSLVSTATVFEQIQNNHFENRNAMIQAIQPECRLWYEELVDLRNMIAHKGRLTQEYLDERPRLQIKKLDHVLLPHRTNGTQSFVNEIPQLDSSTCMYYVSRSFIWLEQLSGRWERSGPMPNCDENQRGEYRW
jgi:hypothetical protein